MSSRLGGRYQLVAEIGAGGMGRVYQAIDTESGRAVAAKVMVAAEENLDALLRFQQEGAVLATLRHPNIVEVYGAFLEMEQQTSCIIMELLEGRSLAQIMRTEKLSLARARGLISQVAAALAYAHGRGIVHRDIKPDNIMVVGNDNAKVTDFGIARILRPGSTLNTVAGMSIGTPLYMSPEQIEGQKVDGRSDIYSLGAVMYEIVTGRPPFDGDDPLTIAFKHVHKAPDAPSDVVADIPREWEDVILKALSKDPAERFQSASALEDAVLSLPTELGQSSRQPAQTVQSTIERPPDAAPANLDPRRSTSRPESVGAMREGTNTSLLAGADRGQERPSGVTIDAAPVYVELDEPSDRSRTRRQGGIGAIPLAVGALLIVLIAAGGGYLALGRPGTPSTPTLTRGAGSPFTVAQLRQFGSSGTGQGFLRSPTDVAVDGSGDVFIADSGNNRVQEFAPTTDFLGSWGQLGAEVTQYTAPWGVALDSHGNIFVTDTGNSRIQELSPSGQAVGQPWGSQGTSDGEFDHPSGIAVDPQGNLYIADTRNNRIQKLSPSGKFEQAWGSKGSGTLQFDDPTGIALDAQGDIYVADTGNNRIVELAPTSDPLNQWGHTGTGNGEFNGPQGVAVDSHGNIYVADTGNDRIQELDQSGRVLFAAGTSGSGSGQFHRPTGITVDGRGHIYVADMGNDRVQEVAVSRTASGGQ